MGVERTPLKAATAEQLIKHRYVTGFTVTMEREREGSKLPSLIPRNAFKKKSLTPAVERLRTALLCSPSHVVYGPMSGE